jgi:pSer/pThr/pTyr-binding forkhead associated (FHA) protein
MQFNLLIVRGWSQEQVIPVQGREFSIGRDSSCDLCVINMSISRRHAALLSRDGKVVVRDLGSRNGTFVNGKIVACEQELRHGDTLRLGPQEYRVQFNTATPSSASDVEKKVEELMREAEAPRPFQEASPEDPTARNRPLQTSASQSDEVQSRLARRAPYGVRPWQLWAALAVCNPGLPSSSAR